MPLLREFWRFSCSLVYSYKIFSILLGLIYFVFFVLLIQSVAEAAEDLWDRYGYDFGTDYSGLFKALSHINYNVRFAAAEALAAALDECPDTIQVCLILNRQLTLTCIFVVPISKAYCYYYSGISFYFIFCVYS